MVVAGNTSPHAPPSLNLPTQSETPPKTLLGRLLLRGRPADEPENAEKVYPWYVVLWLTGVDYFSSLGYQPGIALLAAGALSVPATAVLLLVTLLGAVPVYSQVARRSYAGQGSIALLENLLTRLEGQDLRTHPAGLHRNGFCHYHDAVCSRCSSSRHCKSIPSQLCWRGTHAPHPDVAVVTGHRVHVRLPAGNRIGANCRRSVPSLEYSCASARAMGDSTPSDTPSQLGLQPAC